MKSESSSCPSFTFAFQPIIDAKAREVFSYEALVRGPGNEPAYRIIEKVSKNGLGAFDQKARAEAILLATRLGIGCHLNLNFTPQSLYSSEESIRTTIEAASEAHLPIERVILEITEREIIVDQARFAELINEYRGLGLKVAIDDFGAGYSGLNLLSNRIRSNLIWH
jgi:EAL domain-containing protein (putative c-di-GMP-specific phosphodiesterase class I)